MNTPAVEPPMDEKTFSAIVEATRGPLLAYLRKTCRDDALAEDVFQETYIRLLDRPPDVLAGVGAADELPLPQVRAWLFTTATRLLRDHWRRDRLRAWLPWPAGGSDRGDGPPEPASDVPLQDRRLDAREAVAAGFARLSPRQRSLLWLAVVEGLDHAELARVFRLSPASIRVLLHRARTRMGQALKELGMKGVAW